MAAYESKAHIAIDGYPFIFAMMPRTNRHTFSRDEAPSFVSKVASGDPNYRDSSYFPHWVQNNWLNGFDQEKWNDGGKFQRSGGVNPTTQEELTLQKKFNSLGQSVSGAQVLCQLAWRTGATSAFGTGPDGVLTISADTTDAPIDATCSGTAGSSTLSATNASFAAGQRVLIIQMRGTNKGKKLLTKILTYSAGTMGLQDPLNVDYSSSGTNKAQVIVVKQYSTITIDSGKTLTAKSWDESTGLGGILALWCSGTCTVAGSIKANGVAGVFQSANVGNPETTGGGFYGGRGGGNEPYTGGGDSAAPAQDVFDTNGSGGGGHQDQAGAGGGNGAAGTTSGLNIGGDAAGNAALTEMNMGGGGGGGSFGSNSGSGGSGGGIIYIRAKTLIITGGIQANGGAGGSGGSGRGGGGGAGGSILLETQTGTLGTNLVTASGGAGGAGAAGAGGAGAVGRIHLGYASSFTGSTTPTLDSAIESSLSDTPAGSSFTHMLGLSNGQIYSSDGLGNYTLLFDARRLKWYETGTDADATFGDVGGTEYAEAQSFQLTNTESVKTVELYLKKNAGTPGDITVRIETDNSNKPSGTLANAAAEATIPAFTDASYAWKTVNFSSEFSLSATTKYWIVLKIAAGSNDNNYAWAIDGSSPGYTDGSVSRSADGGSTWTTDAAKDAYFRVLGHASSVNAAIISTISGGSKAYFACGNPESTTNGDAKVITYDGTDWAVNKVFSGGSEVAALAFAEFGATPKLYVGLGGQAKVYSTSDGTTWTLAKKFTVPDNPGYVLTMTEYGGRLYVGGGYPEMLYGSNYQYNGFIYSYDEYSWTNIPQFEYTVVVSSRVYDNLLFIGTIKKHLYVYNTASMDKLFEFPWDVQIRDMCKWDDKLALAIATTPGKASSGEEGIYLFDRNGFHKAFYVTDRKWYSLFVLNNNLVGGADEGYAYKTDPDTYQASGYVQSSYFEASLPSIDKLWRALVLHFDALPSGCSIQVEYKTDESDVSWTNLGTASTVGATSAEFQFPTTFYSKKISLRTTLITSTPANTPTLKILDLRYLVKTDFKYLWKMKLACPDNIVWLDGTEPISVTTTTISYSDTELDLEDGAGFPTKGRGVIVDGGVEDEFTWTGRTGNTLTGVSGLSNHSDVALTVKITGAMLHKTLLTLKQEKKFHTYTDVDGLSYTVMFHQFQADDFIINQESGIENDVPVALLEA